VKKRPSEITLTKVCGLDINQKQRAIRKVRCPLRVKTRKPQRKQKFSAVPPKRTWLQRRRGWPPRRTTLGRIFDRASLVAVRCSFEPYVGRSGSESSRALPTISPPPTKKERRQPKSVPEILRDNRVIGHRRPSARATRRSKGLSIRLRRLLP
jgi:hypothetical protein